MLMFVAIALTSAPVSAAPLQPGPQSQTLSLHIPDEISPAVEPYVRCRLESVGATMTGSDGKSTTPLVSKGGDCTAIGAKAAAEADTLLTRQGKRESARAKLIAKTMKSIDDFADQMGRVMATADKAK
jgi:hypothetical protein